MKIEGPLTEENLRAEVWPLFSRVLERSKRSIYLANHSLGRPLDRTAEDIAAGVSAWYSEMNDAWEPWGAAMDRFRALTATLINAPRPGCIVPKTSAGQGLRAVLNALPGKPIVVATEGEFDSLDFILRVYRDKGRAGLTLVPARPDGRFYPDDIALAIKPGTALVLVSSVMFRTGQVLGGLPELVRKAHAAGAKAGGSGRSYENTSFFANHPVSSVRSVSRWSGLTYSQQAPGPPRRYLYEPPTAKSAPTAWTSVGITPAP